MAHSRFSFSPPLSQKNGKGMFSSSSSRSPEYEGASLKRNGEESIRNRTYARSCCWYYRGVYCVLCTHILENGFSGVYHWISQPHLPSFLPVAMGFSSFASPRISSGHLVQWAIRRERENRDPYQERHRSSSFYVSMSPGLSQFVCDKEEMTGKYFGLFGEETSKHTCCADLSSRRWCCCWLGAFSLSLIMIRVIAPEEIP